LSGYCSDSLAMDNIEKLIIELDQAEKLLSQFSGGYSESFFSAEEFHSALKTHIVKLRHKDFSGLEDLYLWFLPTSDWDDFVGAAGQDLGNSISRKLKVLQKSSGT
jgi:hypothetical protein